MSDARHDETFPTLTEHELELFREISHERAVHAGEILFDQGEPTTKLFVVLEGTVEIVNPRSAGGEPIVVYERGQFTGDPHAHADHAQANIDGGDARLERQAGGSLRRRRSLGEQMFEGGIVKGGPPGRRAGRTATLQQLPESRSRSSPLPVPL